MKKKSPNLFFCFLAILLATDNFAQITSCGTDAPLGVNQICNGDFESGDSCFTTNYIKHSTAPDVSCSSCYRDWSNPNEYEVVTNVVTQFHTGFTSTPTDHTAGSGNHFMAVDGACDVGKKVWQETVAVTPSTNYYFTMWYTSLHSSNPALLQFDIDGTNVGLQQQLVAADGIWYQYTFIWNSGATSGNVVISIENITVTGCGNGNDFAIDDISFVAGCAYGSSGPQPDLGADQNLCVGGGSATLNSGVPVSATTIVKWSTGEGGTIGAGPYSIVVNAPGTYSVCVQDNGSCIKSDIIVVSNNFTIDLGPDVTLCNPTNATLDAGITAAGITYEWRKDGVIISGATSETLNVTSPGVYRVDVTIPGCGTQTDQLTVSSQAAIPNDATFCPPAAANLSVTGTGTYEWYAASSGGAAIATGASYSPAPGVTTTYWVKDVSTFSYQVGPTTMAAGAGADSYASDRAQVFDAYQTFNLDAVTVFGDLYTVSGPFTIGITLRDNTGALIWSQTTDLLAPNPLLPNPTKIVVPVNKAVPIGTGLRLSAEGTTGIDLKWCQSGGTIMAYPYTVAGVMSITDLHPNFSWLPANAGWGYFYNYEISAGVDCERVPVVATSSCPLPIELLNFEAISNTGKVLLNWQTAREKNSADFIIQRSSDGNHFESIGTVKANGNSQNLNSYSFTDYTSLAGITYYRLISVDLDNTRSISPARVVNALSSNLVINPNPNTGNFNISFQAEAGSDVKLALINPLGQMVYEETLQSTTGNYSKNLNIHNLPSGIYYLNIQGKELNMISKMVKE